MGGALVDFFILVVIVCVVAAVILWCVARFFPDIYPPARYVVGAVALIVILVALKPLLSGVLG
jgi:hypothetical protein